MTHLQTSLSTTASLILPKPRKLTGNLDFSGHLHDGAHPVPHDAAVLAGVCPVQRGDQVPNRHMQDNPPSVSISVTGGMEAELDHPHLLLDISYAFRLQPPFWMIWCNK